MDAAEVVSPATRATAWCIVAIAALLAADVGCAESRQLALVGGMLAPAIVGGVLTYLLLPSRPQEASFLTTDEKEWIQGELGREEQSKLNQHRYSVLQALANGRVWHLVVAYFGMMIGLTALTAWAPQLLNSLSGLFSNSAVGLLVSIPGLIGLVAMIMVSRSSDRMIERRYHVAIPAIVAGTALLLLGTTRSPVYSVALLSLLGIGVYSFLAPFWALPNEFLTGFPAAAGIALINSVGNLGGFAGPYMIGTIAARTGNIYAGLAAAGISLFISATLVLLLPRKASAA
jgi:MFS transporter, ACS family, tartrate transporter